MDMFEPTLAEKQELMARVLRGQQAVAANSKQANKFNTLAAVTQLANNPAAAAAAAAADKGAQTRYGTTKLGQQGVLLDATGESVPSEMFFEDKLDTRAQARGLQAERIASQEQLAQQRLADQQAARADRSVLALTLAGMNNAARAQAAEAKATAAGAKPAGKALGFPAIEKLSKKESTRDAYVSLVDSFKPGFSGTAGIADYENTAGKFFPKFSGKGEQANWWQNYADQANKVRNELFGATLTRAEEAAFNAANVTPGMDPTIIQTRLAQQAEAVRKAYAKVIKQTGASGWNVSGFDVADEIPATAPGVVNTGAAGKAPAGVSAEDWNLLTPEERKLWQN